MVSTFSVEEKFHSGQTNKFEDKELEEGLNEDPSQTQEERKESLGWLIKQFPYDSMEMIQKQENWLSFSLKPRDDERWFFTCEKLIQRQKRKGVFTLWMCMRNGYFTTTLKRKTTKLCLGNHRHRPQHQSRISVVWKSYSISGGTKRGWVISCKLFMGPFNIPFSKFPKWGFFFSCVV